MNKKLISLAENIIKDPKKHSAGAIQNCINEIQAAIADKNEQIHFTENAPLPKEETKAKLSEHIDARAKSEDLLSVIGNAIYPHQSIENLFNLEARLSGRAVDGIIIGSTSFNIGPLFCWALGDIIKDRLGQAIDEFDYIAGPPAADRPKITDSLQSEIKQLELIEEQLICAAKSTNIDIPRREDCDPSIVLEFESDTSGNATQ